MIGNISTIEKIVIVLLIASIVICFLYLRNKGFDSKNTDNKKSGNEISDNNKTDNGKDNIETSDKNEIKPVDIPNDARLIGFHIHHMGMAMEPHYIIKLTEKGVYLKLTNTSPDDWTMKDDVDEKDGDSEYFRFADVVKECESGEVVFLENDEVVKELEAFIVKIGAISWDGYNESVSMPGVLDAGDIYDLYMEFSDGTTVTVHGYNSCPRGFSELKMKTVEIFDMYFEY